MGLFYTGVGSRDTPEDILELMKGVASSLANKGYTLRSGGAAGADTAFEFGSIDSFVIPEIYLPWQYFSDRGRDEELESDITPLQSGSLWFDAIKIASEIHPNWGACSSGARALHTRNVFQVLGRDLKTPSKFLVCWAKPSGESVKGGTRTAVELALQYDIPCYNMYFDDVRDRLITMVNKEG